MTFHQGATAIDRLHPDADRTHVGEYSQVILREAVLVVAGRVAQAVVCGLPARRKGCTNPVLIGVGNLYKTEICFLLGVSPWTPVRDVDPDAVVTLARRLLLVNADRPEQSTTGELARGRQHWVYERGGKACRRCAARVIRAVQGDDVYARQAYYCARCQPGPHPVR